jgi:hypothetical protein
MFRAESKAPKRHPSFDTGKGESFDLDWQVSSNKKEEERSLGSEWEFIESRKA